MHNCMKCGKSTEEKAYTTHGHEFCSVNCMNSTFKLGESAELFQFG